MAIYGAELPEGAILDEQPQTYGAELPEVAILDEPEQAPPQPAFPFTATRTIDEQQELIDARGFTPEQIAAAEELVKRGRLIKPGTLGTPEKPGTMPQIKPEFESVEEAGKAGVKTGIHYSRPTIEGLSSVAGAAAGVLAGPGAPLAVPVGGALGYTGAKTVLDRLEDWATLPEDVKTNTFMQDMNVMMNDLKMGLTFELGGAAAAEILKLTGVGVKGGYKKIKDIIRKNTPALSEEQVSKRAAEIIEESRGTLAQYDKNLKEATGIEQEIKGQKFSLGEKTGDPGLIKLQRGIETDAGIAAEVKEVRKAEQVESIQNYLKEKFDGSQTIDDVLENLTAQQAGLKAETKQATKTAKMSEETIPTEYPQATGKRITETIKEAKEPLKKIEKEYWDKVPNYEMTPTNTDETFKRLSGEPSIAQDTIKKYYKAYKERPNTIKGMQTTEREINDIIFDVNAKPTEKRLMGEIKTAIKEDFKALGEAAEQGDFATYQGKIIHPKKLERELAETTEKLKTKSGMTPDKINVQETRQALQEAKIPGIMQQVAEDSGDYAKRIAKTYKQNFGKEPPMIAGKERPEITSLKETKARIEKQLAEAEPAQNAAIAYENAKAFSKNKITDKFRKGVIREIEMLGDFQGGKKLPAEKRPAKLMDNESAEKFIKAVGKENAGDIMLRHYADDMGNKVKYGKDGRLDPASLTKWLKKHERVLDTYGIKDQFATASNAHKAMQNAKIAEDMFNTSIAGKMLNSDPQNAIAQAMSGGEGISSKNTATIMKSLIKKLKGDKNALKGLQNAFKDFMYEKMKTTAQTLKGVNILSNATLQKDMRKYAPAQAVLYRGQPDKIKALQNIQKALIISNRTAKGVGGGPDTAEKLSAIANVLGLIAKLPGISQATKLTKLGLGSFKDINKKELNDKIIEMLYDPDFAKIISKAAKKTPPVRKIQTETKNYFQRSLLYSAREQLKEKK